VRRGEVWWVDFDPSIGGEIQKTRPAVIISNDSANLLLNRLQVVPVSSQVSRVYASEALVTLNGQQRKVMADQLTTISKLRLGNKISRLSDADMAKVDRIIKFQLSLP
jgi:mRNA interferase MazF